MDSYMLTVDYRLSLERMIWAGHYDAVNRYAAWNFSTEGEGREVVRVTAIIFRFEETEETTAGIFRRIKEAGLRPANSAELLAFGARFPDTQREFPIAALGSFGEPVRFLGWDWYVQIMYLGTQNQGRQRILDLEWLPKRKWTNDWRFLCVSLEIQDLLPFPSSTVAAVIDDD